MKYCKGCKTEKELSEFYNNKREKDGKSFYCKFCMNEKAQQWRVMNPEKLKEGMKRRGKKYYQNHLEKEQERARQKNMRPENVQRRKQKYDSNKEEILESQHLYRLNNLDEVREKDRKKKARQRASGQDRVWAEKRRARKLSLPDTLTLEQWKHALLYWNNRCAICDREFGKSIDYRCAADHWIPLSAENCPGTTIDNMIPLCHGKDGCNNSKSTKLPQEWLLKRFGEEKANELLTNVNLYFETVRRIYNG